MIKFKDERNEVIMNDFNQSSQINSRFFDNLETGLNQINGITLTKRQGQVTYAKQVMEAIKEQQILFIQAGVGIGKSYGYIIPIIITHNNVPTFSRILIATSSRALQQQLLTDIHKVSQLLEIPINANIVKGIRNYACLAKLNNMIETQSTDSEIYNQLKNIRQEMLTSKKTADREELSKISDEVWKEIMADNRGVCSQCNLAPRCYYQQLQNKINFGEHQIIIANQALIAYWFKENGISDIDMLVIDEAHNLEDNIRQILSGTLELKSLIQELKRIQKEELWRREDKRIVSDCIKYLNELYKNISQSARQTFRDNHPKAKTEIGEGSTFSLEDNLSLANLRLTIWNLEKLIIILEKEHLPKSKKRLEAYLLVLNDLGKFQESENEYWVKFIDNKKIDICFTRRKLDIVTDYIKSVPTTIFTSGTLIGADGKYTDFQRSIFGTSENDENLSFQYASAIDSDFNYKENTLIYYDPSIESPKTRNNEQYYNEEKYIQDLTNRIDQLIEMTEGKALVLFTAKDIMEKVYGRISRKKYPFEIILQDPTKDSEITSKFSNDTNSCLFATGSYWEGIDIKGQSLSNLIITRLPFPIDDGKPEIVQLYLFKMLVKLHQGFGRGVRSETDVTLISLLDSRVPNYLKAIQEVLPTPKENYTDDLKVVETFIKNKITIPKTL